jgi:alkanesulfonate monooxygenase SsuD/methylene tetrahydromethanopterin reductase-like flavin-dependent oxidoreductase (luciferase family)
MDIAIGLPTTIPGVQGHKVIEWARRADSAGFSSLGTLDRVTYPNYEPLVALAAAAAVTERIRLTTSILLVPNRESAAIVAKQTATLHHLSGGRLVVGVAVGGRADDFEPFGVPMEGRGGRFEEMLEEIKRLWAGEERGFAGGVGPDVSADPPQLIIGGQVDAAFRRAAKYGDGWMMGGAPPEMFPAAVEKLEAAWREQGREGRPRRTALTYYALGGDPERDTRASIGHYYEFAADYAEYVVAGTAKGPDAIRERVRAFEEAGADELVLFPATTDPRQVDELAALVL